MRVYLNVSRGLVRVSDVLEVLVPVLPIEAATLMDPDSGDRPAVHAALEALLPADTPVARLHRFDFYAATRTERLVLVIATGDERPYANVLLTVGGIPA
jgi:L-fucose mutarotase